MEKKSHRQVGRGYYRRVGTGEAKRPHRAGTLRVTETIPARVELSIVGWEHDGGTYQAIRLNVASEVGAAASVASCPLCNIWPRTSCTLCRGGEFDPGILQTARRARLARGLRVGEVAGGLKVSEGFLLRLERGQATTRASAEKRREAGWVLLRYLRMLGIEASEATHGLGAGDRPEPAARDEVRK